MTSPRAVLALILTLAIEPLPSAARTQFAEPPAPGSEPSQDRGQSRDVETAQHRLPTLFGGIQVNESDHDRWAASLRAAGLDSVQVTLYARQQAWDSAQLHWDREAPWVVSEIRAARRAGLRVVLVMRVALEHGQEVNRHLWHGMIWPTTDRFDEWFERYGEFVTWGATIAQQESVDLFVVGNELTSMTSTRPVTELPDLYGYWLSEERTAAVRGRLAACAERVQESGAVDDLRFLDGGRYADLNTLLLAEDSVHRDWTIAVLGGTDAGAVARLNVRRARLESAWRALIAHTRTVYDGPLSYGANFDQFADVGFWDALDALASTAYFPLGRLGGDTVARSRRLRDSWRRVATQLTEAARGLPVLLVELGWTRRLGSTVRPYSYDRVEVLETEVGDALECVHWRTQPEDSSERNAALGALRDVVEAGEFASLHGFTLWKLTTRPAHNAIEPFAVILPVAPPPLPGQRAPQSDFDSEAAADRIFLGHAAAIARHVQRRF